MEASPEPPAVCPSWPPWPPLPCPAAEPEVAIASTIQAMAPIIRACGQAANTAPVLERPPGRIREAPTNHTAPAVKRTT
ncbi:hypothetical protein GCM10010330_35250 [Streptomyces tendae]|nr:hypothetical protein GCM10010330_35250 [Streptomyces tendae]